MIKIIKTVIIISIMLITVTVLYWQKNRPVANGEMMFKKSFVFDHQKIYIEQYRDQQTETFLVRRNWLARPIYIKLSGFEDDVMLCNPNVFSHAISSSVCLIGYVGAHSQNIQFIKASNSEFSAIKILHENGEESENLISDNPKISAIQEGNAVFLYVDQRNYDLDPLNAIVRHVYVYRDNKIIFDKKTALQYNTDNE